jgi:predicted MFS family arabinose efflux permease
MATKPSTSPPGITLKRLLTLAIGARLISDTASRLFYPFLPVICRGLGVSLVAGSSLMTVRTAVGLMAPWGGMAIDRFGVKRTILFAMATQAIGLWWFSMAEGWLAAVGPIILLGIPMATLVPALQVFVSDRVPYQTRGRIIGAVEFSWAAVNLFVLPVVGFLITLQGWATPFYYLSGVTVAGMLIVWQWFPEHVRSTSTQRMKIRPYLKQLLKNRSALVVVLSGGFLFVGTESFFITYAAWLEQIAGLSPSNIGLVVGILGLTEWCGSGLSSAFIDRMGKQRGVLAGFVLSSIMLSILPFLEVSLWMAIAGLAIYSLLFEFTIVSSIPLLSEQIPEARGMTLTMGILAISLSRLIMAPVAAWLMEHVSFTATCFVGAIGTGCGALLLALWAKEHP